MAHGGKSEECIRDYSGPQVGIGFTAQGGKHSEGFQTRMVAVGEHLQSIKVSTPRRGL